MTLSIQEKFDKATEFVQGLPKDGPLELSEDSKLNFYACYKQATVGDVNTPKPGILQFTASYKWTAWNGMKGKSKEEAQKKYVELLIQSLEGITPKTEQIEEILELLKA